MLRGREEDKYLYKRSARGGDEKYKWGTRRKGWEILVSKGDKEIKRWKWGDGSRGKEVGEKRTGSEKYQFIE